jgi:DNA-directed RNA polymerase specialized sigma24 family protein
MLRGDEADVYRDLHKRLAAIVRTRVTANDAIREDACSYAWLQFLRHQPNRDTALCWLATVAIREGWRLASQAGDLTPTGHTIAVARVDTELAHDAREALTDLAGLPDRQRRYLTLLVSGHTYTDICHHTGATHTNVTKHLSRARRTLRAVQNPDR